MNGSKQVTLTWAIQSWMRRRSGRSVILVLSSLGFAEALNAGEVLYDAELAYTGALYAVVDTITASQCYKTPLEAEREERKKKEGRVRESAAVRIPLP
jgi:hypothetical protein